MTIPARAGSFFSWRVSVSPSIPGSCRSIRMSRGWNETRTSRACSASVAVRTSYPSPVKRIRASFRFCGLSSTIRIGSPAITALHPRRRTDFGRGRRPRQDGRESAAWARGALDLDATALGVDDSLRQREAQPGALVFFGGTAVELLELHEKPAQLIGRDSDAGVGDVNAEIICPRG